MGQSVCNKNSRLLFPRWNFSHRMLGLFESRSNRFDPKNSSTHHNSKRITMKFIGKSIQNTDSRSYEYGRIMANVCGVACVTKLYAINDAQKRLHIFECCQESFQERSLEYDKFTVGPMQKKTVNGKYNWAICGLLRLIFTSVYLIIMTGGPKMINNAWHYQARIN